MSDLFSVPEGLEHVRVRLSDDDATRALGRALAPHVRAERFLGLMGPLGAGKTTLMKGLAQALGVDPDDVTSPTYTLINEYDAQEGLTLAHMDLYRLEHVDDLEGIGYWDVLEDPWTVTCVEWLNTLWAAWPKSATVVALEPVQEHRVAHVHVRAESVMSMRESLVALSDSFEVL